MADDKKRSLKLNIAASMLIQVVSLLVNLISKRAIRMYLGVEYLGIQSIYSNFCDVMSFAFLGMGTAMLFSMYGAFARDNKEEIASYYQHYDSLYRKISRLVFAGGVVCTFLALYSVNGEAGAFEVCITFLTYLLSIVLYNRQLVRSYFIQADQRRYVAAFLTGGVDAIALLAEIFILYTFRSYEVFLVCILAKNLLINVLFKKYLQKNYAYIFEPAQELDEKEQALVAANAKDMVLYRFGKVLISNTDSIFISRFTSTLLVGIYSNYQFVIMGIRSVLGAMFEAVRGKVGYQLQTGSLREQYRNFRIYLCINSWLMGCTIVCFYFLIEDFIRVWMGKVDSLTQSVIMIMLVNYYLDESQNALRLYRETAGLFHNIRTMILIKGVANIILSVILGKFWGIMGVLVATTITSAFTLFWYEPRIVYGYFPKSVKNEVLYHVVTISLLAISFAITYAAVRSMQGAGFLFLIRKLGVCLVTSNMVYAFLAVIWMVKKSRNFPHGFRL